MIARTGDRVTVDVEGVPRRGSVSYVSAVTGLVCVRLDRGVEIEGRWTWYVRRRPDEVVLLYRDRAAS